MQKHFYIATSGQSGKFNLVGHKNKVDETLFNAVLDLKLKDFTEEPPESEPVDVDIEHIKKQIQQAFDKKKPVTIDNLTFEIKFTKSK